MHAIYGVAGAGEDPHLFNTITKLCVPETLAHVAKWHVAILNGGAMSDFPELVEQLREASSQKLLSYIMPLTISTRGRIPDSFYIKQIDIAERYQARMATTVNMVNIDMVKGGPEFVDELADLIVDACRSTDGPFLDVCWPDNPLGGSAWQWRVLNKRLLDRVSRSLPPEKVCAGNAGNPTFPGWSWMRENFPYQTQYGGTLTSALLDAPNALMTAATKLPIIKVDADNRFPWTDPSNLPRAMTGYACSMLCGGIFTYNDGQSTATRKPWTWHLPVYSHDFGMSKGPAEMVFPAVFRRLFDNGEVWVNARAIEQPIPLQSGRLKKLPPNSGMFFNGKGNEIL